MEYKLIKKLPFEGSPEIGSPKSATQNTRYTTGTIIITEVKRCSDGCIFKIGDKVRSTPIEIQGFKVFDNGLYVQQNDKFIRLQFIHHTPSESYTKDDLKNILVKFVDSFIANL